MKIIQRPRGKNNGGIKDSEVLPTITSNAFQENVFIANEPIAGAIRGRNPEHPTDRTPGIPTEQMLEPGSTEHTNAITTVQKDNVVIEPMEADGIYTRASEDFYRGPLPDKSRSIRAGCNDAGVVLINGKRCRVRKLTPRECWRLFGFTDKQFDTAKEALNQKHYKGKDKSSSQLYKQAGNTIAVPMLEAVMLQLKGIQELKSQGEKQ